jgi:peptidyl-prolyl cis-trans isomerase D
MVADVNGERIEQIEFERAQRNITQFYRNAFKDNPEILDSVDLRGQAVDQLIRVALMRQEAERLGLGVADSEVRDTIAADPSFQEGGLFDKDRYIRVLRLNRLTPAKYEASQREQILVDKLTNLVGGGVKVADAEARAEFTRQSEKVNLRYVALEASDFTDGIEVSDDEAKTHYDANAESFREEEKVRFSYLLFAPERFTDQVAITDEEAQKYYDENAAEFAEPESVRARHILFRVSSSTSEEEKAAIRARAEAALARLNGGEDFAAVAIELSEDQSNAPQGGELGFFPRGRMVPEFEEAAFSVEPGKISGIVETDFGMHILKVEEKRPAGTRPLADVRAQIVGKLAEPKANELAEAAANAAQAKLAEGTSLADVASGVGMSVMTSEPVTRIDTIPGLRGGAALIDAAMAADSGKHGPVTFTADGYLVFRVDEKIASRIPPLEEVAEAVREAVRLEKAKEAAATRAEELRKQIAESSLDQVAESAGLTVKETGEMTRQGAWIPGVGVSPELKLAAFELTTESPVAPQVFAIDAQQVIAVLGSRTPPADAEFEEAKEGLIDSIEARRRNDVMAAFQQELRDRATISYGRGFRDLG